jgi:hypothetical protein
MNVRGVRTNASINNRTLLALEKVTRISSRWLTEDERQLLDRCNVQSCKNTDASVLYLLLKEYGFTAEQCLEFYQKHKEKYAHLSAFDYSIKDIEEVKVLKDHGIDLTALYEGVTVDG